MNASQGKGLPQKGALAPLPRGLISPRQVSPLDSVWFVAQVPYPLPGPPGFLMA